MEKAEKLQKYKSLCNKNKKAIESLEEVLSQKKQLFSQQNINYGQVKQQYEIILSASKESIQYNS